MSTNQSELVFLQEAADADDPRVILSVESRPIRVSDVRRIHVHCAELVAGKGLAVLAHARLAEEGRASGVKFDEQGEEKEQRGKEDKGKQRENNIH